MVQSKVDAANSAATHWAKRFPRTTEVKLITKLSNISEKLPRAIYATSHNLYNVSSSSRPEWTESYQQSLRENF